MEVTQYGYIIGAELTDTSDSIVVKNTASNIPVIILIQSRYYINIKPEGSSTIQKSFKTKFKLAAQYYIANSGRYLEYLNGEYDIRVYYIPKSTD